MSKHNKVWEYLKQNGSNEVFLTFEQIREICGEEIDHSFLTYKKDAADYGYKVEKISMKESRIRFVKL